MIGFIFRAVIAALGLWLATVWVGVPLLTWASVFFFFRERELQ